MTLTKAGKATETMTTGKGLARRQEIVEAAAAILRSEGPAGVSHRTVARRVHCSLSATTYYFSGLEELLEEAGRLNIGRWASRAERVAEAVECRVGDLERAEALEVILDAMVPRDEILLGHYLQLVAAGGSKPVRRAYRTGRDRLNAAMTRVLRRIGSAAPAELVIAVVDGAAVSAISEGRDLRLLATNLLDAVV
ncbi:hypothetical protein KEM60_01899 [Austwickia sp. TVS 96-490-7B]|uniref:TetR/AcrR family transcriptional regulator n=1 Tax=Austwickia sp. TVS 96-490-7B TaxID=2830843 RepID=UPI001C5A1CD6|nr:TetR/AcrR family transcriptional regulator [Austwickia sp. TVS 96-490-7B]MBW3085694.1 hypothetical protein [Austwickia sp. TVS 96-490-7B]